MPHAQKVKQLSFVQNSIIVAENARKKLVTRTVHKQWNKEKNNERDALIKMIVPQ